MLPAAFHRPSMRLGFRVFYSSFQTNQKKETSGLLQCSMWIKIHAEEKESSREEMGVEFACRVFFAPQF